MALRDVRNDSDAAFVAVDGRGAVYVHQTQRDGPAEAGRFRPSVPVQTAE